MFQNSFQTSVKSFDCKKILVRKKRKLLCLCYGDCFFIDNVHCRQRFKMHSPTVEFISSQAFVTFTARVHKISWNLLTFSCAFCGLVSYWAGTVGCWLDSCQHSIRQLGQVLPTSMTSRCPLRRHDSPARHPGSLEAFREDLRDLLDPPVVQIGPLHAGRRQEWLCFILRLRGTQGHATPSAV